MNSTAILEARRQARAAKHRSDENLFALHKMAADALLDPEQGNQVRAHALQQIEKWDQGHLCNLRYIQAWRQILNLPAPSIPAAILRQDAEGIALRQNSPFGFLINRPSA